MSTKFVNILSKYLPAHFKIAPKDVEVYLNESLDNIIPDKTRYLTATLTPDSIEIPYNYSDDLDPLNDSGVVKIENEYVKYEYKDTTNHKLTEITRGFFGTEAVAHCNEVLWEALVAEDTDAFSTTISFTSVINMDKIPQKGKFKIYTDAGDEEIISYSGYNQWLNGYEFTNVIRGDDGTSAVNHPKGSYIIEFSTILIEQVDTISYDKGLWSATLGVALEYDDTTATLNQKFTANLNSDILANDTTIYLKNISNDFNVLEGDVPKNGYIKIENEIIRYGNYESDGWVDSPLGFTGRLEQCIRGSQATGANPHLENDDVYFALPLNGEFLIDDEYIQYTTYSYDEVDPNIIILGSTDYPLLRGRYETTAAEHSVDATLIERRHVELEPIGIFRIGNEYFKYWHLDDDYFYVDKRPALNAKTYYHTTSTDITSIIEAHGKGALITTYHFDDENSYLVDFIHTVAEHMDLTIGAKVNQFEDFSDIDKVDINYLKFIVEQLGENLDDYQNLSFFSESQNKTVKSVDSGGNIYWESVPSTTPHNLTDGDSIIFSTTAGGVSTKKYYKVSDKTTTTFRIKEIATGDYVPLIIGETNVILGNDYRIRLFTKELVTIYKQKGLLSALKLWHTVISEPLTAFQDLWTPNYCSFYSLPFLALLMYDSTRAFYPNNESFFRPQISKALQEELAEFYEDKKIYSPYVTGGSGITSYAVPDLKLLVHEWEYFCKTDDDVKSSDGRNFDDKKIPCDTEGDQGFLYDKNNVTLQVRSDPSKEISLPFFIEDYTVDLFKFESELDANILTYPTISAPCRMESIDEGFVSDYSSHWILGDPSYSIYEYCDISDSLVPISTDLEVKNDLTSDIGNASIELNNNIDTDDTEVIVKVTNGRLYTPIDHITAGSNPGVVPKGFIKIGNEIISYTSIELWDEFDGSLVNKKYKLTGCTRGENETTADHHKVNLYEGNESYLHLKTIELVPVSGLIYRLILTRDPKPFGIEIGDYIRLVQSDGSYNYNELCEITDIISEYDYCNKTYSYAIEFEVNTSTIPDVDVLSISPSDTYSCVIDEANSKILYTGHGLADGDIIYFLKSVGNIDAYEDYIVINSTPNDFQITTSSSISTFITLVDIKDPVNTYMWSGTRVLKKIDLTSNIGVAGYQHRYSLIQHILWRLDNEINGNDLPLVYNLTSAEIISKKLNSYTGVGNGIIWPTPYFKYDFTVTPTTDFTTDEIIELVLKKLKQYKPKHTVADLTITYGVESDDYQVETPVTMDNYETETMMSDMGGGATDYHIDLSHYIAGVPVEKHYDIPIVTTDTPVLMTDPFFYGEQIDFNYTIGADTYNYGPFISYPEGNITDTSRNRKRFFNYVE